MYATTNRLSLFSLLISIVTVFISALILVYISATPEIDFYISIALGTLVACLAAFTLLSILALRSLRQELSWEFEDKTRTIKELKERIRILEEKVANN